MYLTINFLKRVGRVIESKLVYYNNFFMIPLSVYLLPDFLELLNSLATFPLRPLLGLCL